MDTDERLWARGPGDARTRRYHEQRSQRFINRQRARETKRILGELSPPR